MNTTQSVHDPPNGIPHHHHHHYHPITHSLLPFSRWLTTTHHPIEEWAGCRFLA